MNKSNYPFKIRRIRTFWVQFLLLAVFLLSSTVNSASLTNFGNNGNSTAVVNSGNVVSGNNYNNSTAYNSTEVNSEYNQLQNVMNKQIKKINDNTSTIVNNLINSSFYKNIISNTPTNNLPSNGYYNNISEWRDVLFNNHLGYYNGQTFGGTTLLKRTNTTLVTKTQFPGNYSQTQTTVITKFPEISNFYESTGNSPNLVVPIVKDSQANSNVSKINQGVLNNYQSLSQILKIGLNIEFGWSFSTSFKFLLVRGSFTIGFNLLIKLAFPVEVNITYPTLVLAGGTQYLNMTVIPLNLPNYHEFEVAITPDVKLSVDVFNPAGHYEGWHCSLRDWWGDCVFGYPKFSGPTWDHVFDIHLSHMFAISADYQTPMGDYPSTIFMKQIQLGNAVLPGWIPYVGGSGAQWGIGSNVGAIFGEKLTATLGVYTDNQNDVQTIAWGENHVPIWEQMGSEYIQKIKSVFNINSNPQSVIDAGKKFLQAQTGCTSCVYNPETKGIKFSIPANSTATYVRFDVKNIRYYPGIINIDPVYYVHFTGALNIIPDIHTAVSIPLFQKLAVAIGTAAVALANDKGVCDKFNYLDLALLVGTTPPLTIGCALMKVMTSSYYFTTSIPLTVYSNADYNFNLYAYSIKTANSNPLESHYLILLTKNSAKQDIISLTTNNLPPGFTATFDRNPANYAINNQSAQVAELIITRPSVTTVPPGNYNFNLVATSKMKSLALSSGLNPSQVSISASLPINVPVVHNIGMTMDNSSLIINPNDVVDLTNNIVNYGNVQENYTVNATLTNYLNFNKTWIFNQTLSRYGTGANSQVENNISINFSPQGIMPPPGTYLYTVTITKPNDPSYSLTEQRTIQFTDYVDFNTSITQPTRPIFSDGKMNLWLNITNTGNIADNYSISAEGWTQYVSFPTQTSPMNVGETMSIPVSIRVPNPSILTPATYSFRMVIRSENETSVVSYEDVNVTIISPSTTPPGLSNYYSGNLTILPQSSLNLGPSWVAQSPNPNTYEIFINGTLHNSGSWVNNNIYSAFMTGINPEPVGLYNVTAVFSDIQGNLAVDTAWVKIVPAETTPPILLSSSFPSSTLPVNFLYPQQVSWQVKEQYLLNSTLYVNGVKTQFNIGTYCNNTNCYNDEHLATFEINPGSLSIGSWNFTLTTQNMNNYNMSSTYFLNVISADISPPTVITYPTNVLVEGINNAISFEATDLFPSHYELYLGSTLYMNNSWANATVENININSLPLILGINNLELKIYDMSGNFITYNWALTLSDITKPVVLQAPNNLIVFEHNITLNNVPEIVVEDKHPGTFTLSLYNGSIIETGNWIDNNGSFPIEIDFLRLGTYVNTLTAYDTSGNSVSYSFTITVRDVTAPVITPISPIYYDPNYVANFLNIQISDNHPRTFQVFRNGTLTQSGSIQLGRTEFSLFLGSLTTGVYFYTVNVTDASGNIGTRIFEVFALDYTPPEISNPPYMVISEGSTGSAIDWQINDINLKSYNLYENGTLIDSGLLNPINGKVSTNTSLNGLSLGLYDFILVAKSINGLTSSGQTYVQVVDSTRPQISNIGEVRIISGTTGNELIWTVIEKHPQSYKITVDGTTVTENPYSGGNITYQLVGFSAGTYKIVLTVTDTSGNIGTDIVTLEVISATTTPQVTTSPGFTLLMFIMPMLVGAVMARRKYNKKR